jgi:hypothetical protein
MDAQERSGGGMVPDAHDPKKKHAPIMFTTDLSLRLDPSYEKISRRFLENPQEFADAFCQGLVQADAPRHGADRGILVRWFPRSRCSGRIRFPRWIMN